MAINNPGNGDVPPTSLLRATLQPEATACSQAGYAYDYTRNCYIKGDNSIAVRDVCAALAERDAVRATNAELLAALETAYTILGDNRHQWAQRHTARGQGALSAMRDAIVTATGRDAQDVQDDYCNRILEA